jgi:hypothetical protein
MDGDVMSMLRKAGMLVALPITVAALSGAATSPTVTYHGFFDEGSVTCADPMLAEMFTGAYTGIWNVRIPDPQGTVAFVKVNIKLNGEKHANWSDKFVLDQASAGAFSATRVVLWDINPWTGEAFDPPARDVLTMSLDTDGDFTYVLDSEVMGCIGTMTGETH